MANEYNYEVLVGNSDRYTTKPFLPDSFEVGENGGSQDGALRVGSLYLAKNTVVASAILNITVGVKGAGSGDLKYSAYGIAEDNTGSFSSDPFGRSKTSAVTNGQTSLPPVGERFGINVTSQVNEILARSGWSSGNAIGFIVQNNGSNSNVYVFNALSLVYLEITLTSRPNFYPTHSSATSPSNPAKTHSFGMKIAKQGGDALTDADEDLAFSTGFPLLKALLYGQDTVPADTLKEIVHDLAYKGAFLIFAQEDLGGGNFGPAYKVPFILYSVSKDANLISGWIDDNNLNIMASGFVQGATSPPLRIYYYIFIDDIDL